MTPSGRGFARFFGSYDDASDYVNHCDVNGHYDLHYEETEPFEANSTWQFTRPYHYYPSGPEMVGKHANTIFQEKAQQFIHEHQARYGIDGTPMFLYFAPMSFQEPLQAPKWTAENCTVAGGFSSAPNANRQTLCRMAIALDKTIEQIADSLAGASREWVMIIASDSGGSAARKGSGGSNWPLRGSKGEVWEGGMRTKALVTGSFVELRNAQSKGHTYSGLVHLVDWHTMILHLAHASGLRPAMPEDPDGLQFWEELLTNTPSPRREFISNVTGFAALRSGDYKLVKAPDGGKSPWTGENQGFRWPVRDIENNEYLSVFDVNPSGSKWTKAEHWKLYNIRSDPGEEVDLAQSFPEEVKRLEERYQSLLEQGRKSSGNDMLKCAEGACADIAGKAVDVMRAHAKDVQLNHCRIQEPAYPWWDEALELAARPFDSDVTGLTGTGLD